MAKTADYVILQVRTLLDDDDAVRWADFRILPKLQLAQQQLIDRLILGNHQITVDQSAVMDVPAATVATDLVSVSGYPTNLRTPTSLFEKADGETDDHFVMMQPVTYLPFDLSTTTLGYWSWRDSQLLVPAVSSDREVLIQYKGDIIPVAAVTDSVLVDGAETFLAFRTAELLLSSYPGPLDSRITYLRTSAEESLEVLLRVMTKSNQRVSTRPPGYNQRTRYSRFRGR